MSPSNYIIHQCSNPDCRFRFPVPPGVPRPIRCPHCGSHCEPAAVPAQPPTGNPRAANPPGPEGAALLDNIRSSYNVGSMFRTADGAGLSCLHLAGTTPTPEHHGVAKTSLGAEFSVPWEYHRNGLEAAQQLKDAGYQLWALEVGSQSVPLFEALPAPDNPPILLVVGNEVAGIDPGILAICDRFIWIPMQGFKRSLNVATAFGVAAYHLRWSHRVPAASQH